jgi:hypothetical protein
MVRWFAFEQESKHRIRDVTMFVSYMLHKNKLNKPTYNRKFITAQDLNVLHFTSLASHTYEKFTRVTFNDIQLNVQR